MAALGLGLGLGTLGQRPRTSAPEPPVDPTLQSLLFDAGQAGALYNPSVTASLYQDAAGTIPWATNGDPVGRLSDQSGNAYHATQATAASRPLAAKYSPSLNLLSFDGTDDYLTADSAVASAVTGDDFFLLLAFTPATVGAEQILFSAHDTANQNKLIVGIATDGTLLFAADTAADAFYTPALTAQQSHVLSVTIAADGTTALRLDGAPLGSYGPVPIPWSDVTKASIGMEWDASAPSDFYPGILSALAFGFYLPAPQALANAETLLM